MQRQGKRKKADRVLSIILAITMFMSIFWGIDISVQAAEDELSPACIQDGNIHTEDKNPENAMQTDPIIPTPVGNGSGDVTRLEWLYELATAFEMSVEEDNYPDNYYSDISSSDEYYYEVMLATEFGLVDVEPGDPLRPNDPATREFTAHTMNLCMGYQPEEGIAYTFSEAAAVTYADDIQIAIDQGWFVLASGAFLPEQGITVAEKTALLEVAKTAVVATKVEEDYDSQYEFAEGVTVIPRTKQIALTGEDELTIFDCDLSLKQGDKFVVFSGDFPIGRVALSVEKADGNMIIKMGEVETSEIFSKLDLQGRLTSDLKQIQPQSNTAVMTYYVGGTAENNYEDGTEYASLDEVGDQTISAVQILETYDIPEVTPQKSNAIDGEKLELKCVLSNADADYNITWGYLAPESAYFNVNMDVTFNCSAGIDSLEDLGIKNSTTLCRVNIDPAGFLYADVKLEADVGGEITLSWSGNLDAGVHWNRTSGFRMTKNFNKKAFTIQATVEGTLGIKAEVAFDVVFLKGEIYAKAGAKASLESKNYIDGKKPQQCMHMSAYLYAEAGCEVKLDILGLEASAEYNCEFLNEDNSPVKVVIHCEDGERVSFCTRDGAANKYYTPIDSQYACFGANKGTGSNGEEFTMFEYELGDALRATLTKYHGNVSALKIPDTIDGYTVGALGWELFKDDKRLRMVLIPDSVTEIGEGAFAGCSNLVSVTIPDAVTEIGSWAFQDCSSLSDVILPKSLEVLASFAFENCDSLKSIEIPKSLRDRGSIWGAFNDCDNLKRAVFESGSVEVPYYLFAECTGLEEVVIPDTVTTIKGYAFANCISLRKVTIPDSVTTIEEEAFNGCTSLAEVTLSKWLTKIGSFAFRDCDALQNVEIPKSLEGGNGILGVFVGCDRLKTATFEEGSTTVPGWLFSDCPALEEIVLPETVAGIGSYAFEKCPALKEVAIPKYVMEIGEGAFRECSSLAEVVLPDSVLEVGPWAFAECKKLSNVTLSKSLVALGKFAFENCDALTQIEIPKSLKERDSIFGAFTGCDSLKKATFEAGATVVPSFLFAESPALETVILADSMTKIGYNAFAGCTALREVQMCDSLTEIEEGAFSGCTHLSSLTPFRSLVKIKKSAFEGCSALKDIEFSENLTSVGRFAFRNTGLTKIVFPNSVTFMDDTCFAECTSLKSVVLSNGLTAIPGSAFKGCLALEKVILPWRVKEVRGEAFANCPKLTELTIPRATIKISNNSFSYHGSMTVYGVAGTYAEEWANEVRAAFVAQTIPATEIKISEENLTMAKGEKISLIVTVNPIDFTDELILESSNEAVATISSEGVVTAKGVGEADILVVAGDVIASCKVTVVQPITAVSLDKKVLSLEVGDTYELKATIKPDNASEKALSWGSSDEEVATVDQVGKVTAIKKGTTRITVTAGSVSATCIVTVSDSSYVYAIVAAIGDENGNPYTEISIGKNDSRRLYAILTPPDGKDHVTEIVMWSSSDEGIVAVSKEGKITSGGKAGTAVIKLKTKNCEASVTVQVTGDTHTTHTVTFDMQGHGTPVAAVLVAEGEKLATPTAPTADGYTFEGWYKEAACTNKWDFASDTVTEDITLYAKWQKVSGSSGNKQTGDEFEDVDDSTYPLGERIDLKSVSGTISAVKGKVYDGQAYDPVITVTVTEDGKKLTLDRGRDYRVLLTNNVDAGKGKVTVKGNGRYKGELTAEFTISPKPAASLKVYAGGMKLNSTAAPKVYVYDGTKLLQAEKDYTLSYDKGLASSAGKKDVTLTMKGNYTGSKKVQITVYDKDKVLTDEDVKLEYESKPYTGKLLKPVVTVTCEGKPVDAKSYTVKYINNKEVGTACVIVTGKGEYGGCVVKLFEITPVKGTFTMKKPIPNKTYNAKFQRPKVVIQMNGKKLKAGRDYILYYGNNLHASTDKNKAYVTVIGQGNYVNSPEATFEFTILPRKINKAAVKGTKGNLTVTFSRKPLQENADYTVSYGAETSGKVAVTLTGMGDYTGAVTKKVKL